MLHEEEFLRTIREFPSDDAPRLVYADFLEETGQEELIARAEFIRLQCQSAGDSENALQVSLNKIRETELQKQYGDSWLGSLAHPEFQFTFHRGFIDRFHHKRYFFSRSSQGTFDARLYEYLKFYSDGFVRIYQNDGVHAGMFGAIQPNNNTIWGEYCLDGLVRPIKIRIHSIGSWERVDYRGVMEGFELLLDRSNNQQGRHGRYRYVLSDG